MSQHPIDDLFSRQLKNHGVKTERASWEELQRRINAKQERQSPLVWWYASAASVAVVMLVSWALWSGTNTPNADLATNRIAQQTPEKSLPTDIKATEENKVSLKAIEEPVSTYQKNAEFQRNLTTRVASRSGKNGRKSIEIPSIPEKSETPILAVELQKPETSIPEVALKPVEKTLVVQIPVEEMKPMGLVDQPIIAELVENDDDQPKKKRFRLGRIIRQFNKLKAGEPVEWTEVGPGALIARASEKVQEGKEKVSDSYENLRYNAFRKNSNNK